MCVVNSRILLALCLLLSVSLSMGAPYLSTAQEDQEKVVEDGGVGPLEDGIEEEEEEGLPVQALPDPVLMALNSRLPVYLPQFLPQDFQDVSDSEVPFTSPLKRGRYNRLDMLKRSRLNQLIHRLLAMRGDRYSYHRASPVRFAAGRR